MIEDDELWLDVDVRNGGRQTMWRLIAECGPLPVGPKALTGSGDGSSHRVFKRPPGDLVDHLGPGVELRTAGYLIVEPSHTWAAYNWQPERHLLDRAKPNSPCRVDQAHGQGNARRFSTYEWLAELTRILENAIKNPPATGSRGDEVLVEMTKQARDNGATKSEATNSLVLQFLASQQAQAHGLPSTPDALKLVNRVFAKPSGRPWGFGPYAKPVPFSQIVEEVYTDEPSLLGNGFLTRGSVNLLAGEGGVGKTSLAMQLGLSLGAQIAFLGMEVKEPAGVLYLLAEGQPEAHLRPRQERSGNPRS